MDGHKRAQPLEAGQQSVHSPSNLLDQKKKFSVLFSLLCRQNRPLKKYAVISSYFVF